jgi:hypothetical protein
MKKLWVMQRALTPLWIGHGNTGPWRVGFGGPPKPTSQRRPRIAPLNALSTQNIPRLLISGLLASQRFAYIGPAPAPCSSRQDAPRTHRLQYVPARIIRHEKTIRPCLPTGRPARWGEEKLVVHRAPGSRLAQCGDLLCDRELPAAWD